MKKIIAILMLMASTQMQAAFVGGGASFDSFSVSTTGTASFTLTGGDFFIADTILNDFSPFVTSSTYSDITPTVLSDSDTIGAASASADADVSGSSSSSMADATTAGNAFASTLSDLDFEVDGIGDVTLTMGVSLFADITGALGSEFVDVGLAVSDTFGGLEIFSGFFDGSFGDVSTTDSDTLTLTLAVSGFDTGVLSFESSALVDTGVAPSVVPLPAAVWFLLTGLAGLFGFSRRSK